MNVVFSLPSSGVGRPNFWSCGVCGFKGNSQDSKNPRRLTIECSYKCPPTKCEYAGKMYEVGDHFQSNPDDKFCACTCLEDLTVNCLPESLAAINSQC